MGDLGHGQNDAAAARGERGTQDQWPFWALPPGLRPVEGGAGETIASLLDALDLQAATPPFAAQVTANGIDAVVPGAWGLPGSGASVTIADGMVHVSWRQGLRRCAFSEPLDAYAGVARWAGAALRRAPLFTWQRRWWVVGLVHRMAPGRSVPLGLSRSFTGVPEHQAAMAEALSVPALVERPDGGVWRRDPAPRALLPLGQRLAAGDGPGGKASLPFSAAPAPGGGKPWGQVVVDRWLALLFLPPAASFFGGWGGILAGGLVPLTAYAALWLYWQRPDRLRVEADGTLTLWLARPFAPARRVRISTDRLLALRVDAARLEAPRLVAETLDGAYSLRVGGLDASAARALRTDVLRALGMAETERSS